MREKIIAILNEINDSIDYENEINIIDDGLLDSFEIVSMLSAISNEFDIDISPKYLIPQNFNSISAIEETINKIEND